jgi:hypothetical protein
MSEEGHELNSNPERIDEEPRTVQLVYEPNPKHSIMPSPGRRGSRCPPGVDGATLLASSELVGNKRYATDGTNAYCGQRHDPGNVPDVEAWHGYPIGWEEVPPALVTKWVAQDKVQRRTIRQAKRR